MLTFDVMQLLFIVSHDVHACVGWDVKAGHSN